MSLTTVVGRVLDPAHQPVADATVTGRLVGPPLLVLAAEQAQLTTSVGTRPAADGVWSLALTPQLEVAPVGTYYEVQVRTRDGTTVLPIAVPVSADAVPVTALLVNPATLDPAPLVGASYYLQRSELGGPGGPATLGSDGLVLPEQLPAAGAATALLLPRIAASTLSGHRLVVPTPVGTVEYADPADVAHRDRPLWMTTQAAMAGDTVQVLAYGMHIEPTWSWSPGLLFVGPAGQLTQAVPTAPAAAWLGVPASVVTPTSIFFAPLPSIALAG